MFFRRCKGFPLEEQMGRQAGTMNAWKTSVSTELYHHITCIKYTRSSKLRFTPMVYMLTVRSAVRELLQAFFALVGFLSAVQSSVLYQVVLVFESLVTTLALVGTFV